MNWVDYTITQAGPHFTIKGEWAGEVMGTWSKIPTIPLHNNFALQVS